MRAASLDLNLLRALIRGRMTDINGARNPSSCTLEEPHEAPGRLCPVDLLLIGLLQQRDIAGQIDTVKVLAPGVYFHEADLSGKGHCNNGWVIFDDYVLVLDANFPSGAQEIIPKIRAQTTKPIRFAFDTHHHGDHVYGNQVWVDNGAIPVAHENVIAEMRKDETGFFGGPPGRWEGEAKQREDMRATRLKPPTLLYRDVIFR